MVDEDAVESAESYLRLVDRMLPGRVQGFYLVGSTALGAYRSNRSDIDFVAVIDRDLTREELRRLRVVHFRSAARTTSAALRRGLFSLPGTCNGVYLRSEDLPRPVSTIVPIASHVAQRFRRGQGFDVNPVAWHTFARHGIPLRGAQPSSLDLDPEPQKLVAWNKANLEEYWKRWAVRALRRPTRSTVMEPRWATAWGVLGAPRLHYTIMHRGVISKEQAGEYALEEFDRRWHPIIKEGLAFWRGDPADPSFARRAHRRRVTAQFVLAVAESALG